MVWQYVNEEVRVEMLMVDYDCITQNINAEVQEDSGIHLNLQQQ